MYAASMTYLHHAVLYDHEMAFLWTIDSDVIALAVDFFTTFQRIELTIMRMKSTQTHIPVREVSMLLGPGMCRALPFFHIFTRCSVTSNAGHWETVSKECLDRFSWCACNGNSELE